MAGFFAGRTIFITGASRGIGEAMALKFAADGANVVIAAKSDHPHPKLPGTIHTVAQAVREAGGQALAVKLDVRDDEQIQAAMDATIAAFGGLDVLVNNAGAIFLSDTANTPMKRFDLMHAVNVRAVFALTQAALPHLRAGHNPHVLNLSPPLSLEAKWFAPHLAYTLSKFGMSMCTLGMAAEFRPLGIAVNSLWPRTLIATAAVDMLLGPTGRQVSRIPAIVADAAHAICRSEHLTRTGHCLLDEDVLRDAGTTDFSIYDAAPHQTHHHPDLFTTG